MVSSTKSKHYFRCFSVGNNVSVCLYFVLICLRYIFNFFVYIYRIYQDRDDSLHSHPMVPHRSGQLFNNKSGGISRTAKSYHVRDIHWIKKHIICVRETAKAAATGPKDIGQHAGNALETKHSLANTIFKYINYIPIYWGSISQTQIKIIFALNIKNTESLFRKYEKNPGNFKQRHINLMNEINKIHEDYIELNIMREKLDDFGHGWLWWRKIDRTENKWLKGIKYDQCIKRVSKLLAPDYTLLFSIVYNSKFTKYGNFDHVDFILKNNEILKKIQRKLHYRMSITEIKTIVYKEWTASADLQFEEIFDIKDESEDELLEIPKCAGKKSKKHKYSETFVLFFYIFDHICIYLNLFVYI